MTPPLLIVNDLCKRIRQRTIIDHVSFTVGERELFGLLGPNGAGKSTIMRMLIGLVRPTAGSVFIDGHSIQKQPRAAMRQVDCMIESPPILYPFLTGRQHLQLVQNMNPDRIPSERLPEVAEQMKITSYLDSKVKTYSTGMKQRLGIAQALLTKPKLLILDEPTNGLDPLGIRELRGLLHDLVQRHNISVLLSTHLLHEAEALCDRVAMLHQGSLLYVGPPQIQLEAGQQQTVIWSVQPLAEALAAVGGHAAVQGEVQRLTPHELAITMDTAAVASLNQFFVEHGFHVQGIQVHQPTLEEHFIAKTVERMTTSP